MTKLIVVYCSASNAQKKIDILSTECTFVLVCPNKQRHFPLKHQMSKRVKAKWSRYRPGVPQRVGRGIALLFHDRGTRRWVSGQQHAPAALYPRERPGTHFTGGWVGPRAGLDERKSLVPTGTRSRTVKPLVSCYTDWATGPTHQLIALNKWGSVCLVCGTNWLCKWNI